MPYDVIELVLHWFRQCCLTVTSHYVIRFYVDPDLMMPFDISRPQWVYSLWPSDAQWWLRSGSILAQVTGLAFSQNHHLPDLYEIKRKNLFKSTCPTGSFTCPGPLGHGKQRALGNVLLPDGIKPLPEPMLTNYQWGLTAFICSRCLSLIWVEKSRFLKKCRITAPSSRGQRVKQIRILYSWVNLFCFQSRFCSNLSLPNKIQKAATHIARRAVELDLVPS